MESLTLLRYKGDMEGLAAERLVIVQSLTARLARMQSRAEIAAFVLEEGVAALGGSTGSLCLLLPDGENVEIAAAFGFSDAVNTAWATFPLDADLPASEAIRDRTAVWFSTPEERDERYPIFKTTPVIDDDAVACVPFIVDDTRCLGALVVGFRHARDFSDDDIALLQALATQCAIALDRARLFEDERAARAEAERVADRLRRLQRIAAALSGAVTVEQVADVAVALTAPRGAHGSRGLWVVDGNELRLVQEVGMPAASPAEFARIPLTADLPITAAVTTRLPVVVGSTEDRNARFPALAALPAITVAFIIVPLVANERALGTFIAGYQEQHAFDDDEIAFYTALGDQCAQALDRVRLIEAQQATQGLQEFLDALAHDLRNPVAAIDQAVLIVGEDVDHPLLSVIANQAGQLKDMVDDLTETARLEGRVLESHPASVDVRDAIEATVAGIEADIDVDVPAGLTVLVDPSHLRRMTANFITNAVRHGAAPISVRAMAAGDTVEIMVEDHGNGVPAEFVPRLFERFSRGGRHGGGLGLGLSIVRGLARANGGDAWYQPADGGGACFMLRLPVPA